MDQQVQQVFQDSMNSMGLTIMKYLIIAAICALPFVWINTKLEKREEKQRQQKKDAHMKSVIKQAIKESKEEQKK